MRVDLLGLGILNGESGVSMKTVLHTNFGPVIQRKRYPRLRVIREHSIPAAAADRIGCLSGAVDVTEHFRCADAAADIWPRQLKEPLAILYLGVGCGWRRRYRWAPSESNRHGHHPELDGAVERHATGDCGVG